MSRVIALPVAIIFLLLAAACSQRPTEAIRADGDFEFRRGNYDRAAGFYQEIVERHPGDAQAQHHLGVSLTHIGRPAEGRVALEQALSLDPGNEAIADGLAEAMYREGAENELFAFLRGRADATRSTKAYLDWAKYAMELNDLDSASVALMTAIEVDEGRTTEPYLRRAEWAARTGANDEVVRRLRQAYGINPHDPRVLEQLRQYGEVPGPTLALPPGR